MLLAGAKTAPHGGTGPKRARVFYRVTKDAERKFAFRTLPATFDLRAAHPGFLFQGVEPIRPGFERRIKAGATMAFVSGRPPQYKVYHTDGAVRVFRNAASAAQYVVHRAQTRAGDQVCGYEATGETKELRQRRTEAIRNEIERFSRGTSSVRAADRQVTPRDRTPS